MNSEARQYWDHIHARSAPSTVSWYQRVPALSLALIAKTGVMHNDAIIDVGGGASLLVDHLLEAGYSNIAVLDVSPLALTCSRRRLGARGAQVEWFEQDVTRFAAPRRFRLWHDRAVFHFLTRAADREEYMRALRRAVAPGGHVIMAAFALGGPTRCSGLPIVQYDAPGMQAELGADFRLLDERAEVHLTPAGKEQKFAFFRFQRV